MPTGGLRNEHLEIFKNNVARVAIEIEYGDHVGRAVPAGTRIPLGLVELNPPVLREPLRQCYVVEGERGLTIAVFFHEVVPLIVSAQRPVICGQSAGILDTPIQKPDGRTVGNHKCRQHHVVDHKEPLARELHRRTVVDEDRTRYVRTNMNSNRAVNNQGKCPVPRRRKGLGNARRIVMFAVTGHPLVDRASVRRHAERFVVATGAGPPAAGRLGGNAPGGALALDPVPISLAELLQGNGDNAVVCLS